MRSSIQYYEKLFIYLCSLNANQILCKNIFLDVFIILELKFQFPKITVY